MSCMFDSSAKMLILYTRVKSIHDTFLLVVLTVLLLFFCGCGWMRIYLELAIKKPSHSHFFGMEFCVIYRYITLRNTNHFYRNNRHPSIHFVVFLSSKQGRIHTHKKKTTTRRYKHPKTAWFKERNKYYTKTRDFVRTFITDHKM